MDAAVLLTLCSFDACRRLILPPPLPLCLSFFPSGLAEWADNTLKPLGAGKIQSLGEWKFCQWAEALTQLAHLETADGASA